MPHPTFSPDSLWPHPRTIELQGDIPAPRSLRLLASPDAPPLRPERSEDFALVAGAPASKDPEAYPLRLVVASMPGSAPETYELSIRPEGADIVASDAAALEHGVETLLQIAALSRHSGRWPCLRIRDWPRYQCIPGS